MMRSSLRGMILYWKKKRSPTAGLCSKIDVIWIALMNVVFLVSDRGFFNLLLYNHPISILSKFRNKKSPDHRPDDCLLSLPRTQKYFLSRCPIHVCSAKSNFTLWTGCDFNGFDPSLNDMWAFCFSFQSCFAYRATFLLNVFVVKVPAATNEECGQCDS